MTNPPALWQIRVALGLLQGAVLYALYWAAHNSGWPDANPQIFAPALVVAWFLPISVSAGLRNMSSPSLSYWTLGASLALVLLTLHDLGRDKSASAAWPWFLWENEPGGEGQRITPSYSFFIFSLALLFVSQSLATASDRDRKLIARYTSYFDAAWKYAVQFICCLSFVGLFWLTLWLGSALFELIGLEFFKELLEESWFVIPATALAMSAAIHITDVKPALIVGLRTLKMNLLTGLLAPFVLILIGFLVSLPFTGLETLWQTESATFITSCAAALQILIVSAAYQDGESVGHDRTWVRRAASVASVVLTPMIAIAIFALGLRVNQYGWTTDRVIAAACIGVIAWHSFGYTWAALSGGPWLKRIEKVNIWGAGIAVLIFAMLFSPIADPARISVANQVERLTTGRVVEQDFDVGFLRFDGARYGQEILEAWRTDPPDFFRSEASSKRILAALNTKNEWELGREYMRPSREEFVANVTVFPSGRQLPSSFVDQAVSSKIAYATCIFDRSKKCSAFLMDLNRDSTDDIILVDGTGGGYSRAFLYEADGSWVGWELSENVSCEASLAALRQGSHKVVSAARDEILVGGSSPEIDETMG